MRECMLASRVETLARVSAPSFLRVYLCFAAAYLLSYVYRNVNAVISPELTASLGIGASSLGLLTSAYFVAFAAMQIPAGMLLDRYGPRRVEPVLPQSSFRDRDSRFDERLEPVSDLAVAHPYRRDLDDLRVRSVAVSRLEVNSREIAKVIGERPAAHVLHCLEDSERNPKR